MKCFLIFLSLIISATAVAEGDPFRPTVSRRESEWIQTAVERSGENPLAAAQELREQAGRKPGAAVWHTLGNLYFQADRLEDAAEAYEQALEVFPAFREAAMNLGRVYLNLDQPHKVIPLYQRLVRDGRIDAVSAGLLGQALLQQERPVSAEAAFRHSLLLDTERVESRRGLLMALLAQERHAEAEHLAGELLGEAPGEREYWVVMANARLAQGNTGGAAKSLEQARRLRLGDAPLLKNLAQLYLSEEMPAEALECYVELLELEAMSASDLRSAGEGLMQLEAFDEVEQLLAVAGEQVLAEEAGDEMDWVDLRLRVARNEMEEAEKRLDAWVRRHPLDGEALLLWSEVLMAEGDLERAVLKAERARRAGGVEPRALRQLARLAVAQGRISEAVERLDQAQVLDPRPQVERYLRQLRRIEREI